MLRTKLILAIAACLAMVFVMAALLFWGPSRMAQQLDRSLLAHRQAESYLRLYGEAFRYFWQLADRQLVAGEIDPDMRAAGRERIGRQLRELEQLTIDELGLVGRSEPDERQELLQIRQLAEAIAASVVAFDGVADAIATEKLEDRLALLHQKVDRDFTGLIDAALADERQETRIADGVVRNLVDQLKSAAAILAIVAALIVGGIGYWLLRSIKAPIEALMEGTKRVAGGDLGHRIPLHGGGELAHLAASFNSMAGDLERQRSRLMQAQTELEERVQARTKELEQANLTLQRLDEVRRRMFADISHELRTPLTIISGEAEVTLRSNSKAVNDYRTTLGRIVDLAGHVARLVEDLMLLARSDSADLRIRRRKIVIEDVLREATEDLQALASSKTVDVTIHMPERSRHLVYADKNRLSQLLLILVDNACRYTEMGGQITVSLEARGDHHVTIRVVDTGIGVPRHEMGAVFDRYFRGERARRMAPKGVGLGLHVAKTIADAHEGSLEMESEAGRGTTVILTIPQYRQEAIEHANSAD